VNGSDSIQPFDLYRLFIGNQPPLFLLEIVFRTIFMYVYTLVLLRFIGKRALGELTMFEYVTVFILGSAIGDPMFYPEVPLLYGMTVLTVFVIMQRVTLSLSSKKHPVVKYIEGDSGLIIRNGTLLSEELKKQGVTKDHIYMMLREEGIQNINEVQLAYLEPSGKISVFKQIKAGKEKGSTLPQNKLTK
jgi:uncharacterized membrane protein YcaP (DUF421 family)